MAIDSEFKRRSAICTRRLPWFRRFTLPLPDGTIGQRDRQQLAYEYGGVLTTISTASTTADWREGVSVRRMQTQVTMFRHSTEVTMGAMITCVTVDRLNSDVSMPRHKTQVTIPKE